MTEVKVNFYLKRNEEKVDGTVLILRRIRIGKSMVQFSAKVKCPGIPLGYPIRKSGWKKQNRDHGQCRIG
ncbi:MAG: hypothetical protein LBS20_17885 [Prevotella sp.]|jgi:hypothetical protein|nr:hypothetical protein [Prevotella sp.]